MTITTKKKSPLSTPLNHFTKSAEEFEKQVAKMSVEELKETIFFSEPPNKRNYMFAVILLREKVIDYYEFVRLVSPLTPERIFTASPDGRAHLQWYKQLKAMSCNNKMSENKK